MASQALDSRQPQKSGTELRTEAAEQPITKDAVATRAYELWQARGCPIGSPEIDWFRAEQELHGGSVNQKRAPEKRPLVQDSAASIGATEDLVNMPKTVPERVDKHGSKIEDAAGTGEHDSLGG